ncbi:MAG: type II toxin-antitoxin system Phd/YefM family antitoxin [Chloroflexi bacterium]|nr:type II toxin-antitoxin system Phd/YefM family antitoxin [Chloroflexota bacterium]
MRTIGSRELKAHLGEVLRHVREHQEAYVVTHRGRVIARLVPEGADHRTATEFETLWSEMDQLAEEIGREWPEGVPAAQAVSDDRREL